MTRMLACAWVALFLGWPSQSLAGMRFETPTGHLEARMKKNGFYRASGHKLASFDGEVLKSPAGTLLCRMGPGGRFKSPSGDVLARRNGSRILGPTGDLTWRIQVTKDRCVVQNARGKVLLRVKRCAKSQFDEVAVYLLLLRG